MYESYGRVCMRDRLMGMVDGNGEMGSGFHAHKEGEKVVAGSKTVQTRQQQLTSPHRAK